jgi:hypothetical protein
LPDIKRASHREVRNVIAHCMKRTRWVSFTWDLSKAELPEVTAPRHYRIALAGAEDQEELQRVITKSLELDPSWNGTLHDVRATVTASIARALAAESTRRLTLRHGSAHHRRYPAQARRERV